MEHLETIWQQPDEGIWETRGGRKHFTYSKVMAWVAFDRMIKDAEDHGLPGPVERWRPVRDQIKDQVLERGFHKGKNSFTQHFDTDELDASLLLIPLVGFLPHDDPRVRGTTAAVETELLQDGFVLRYSTQTASDGLPPGEGAFLACSFWLVDNWHMQDREADARGAVRAPARPAQRRRPAERGIRPGRQAHDRQLPAGVQPHGADRQRDEPRPATGRHRRGRRSRAES